MSPQMTMFLASWNVYVWKIFFIDSDGSNKVADIFVNMQ